MSEVTVHIIDDDDAVRTALCTLLRAASFTIKEYSSAEQFLKHADNGQPGCILADLRMPGMGGLELQQALNERHSPLPLIFMSAHADVAVAVKAMKAGAADFLEKPVNGELLVNTIGYWTQHALQIHQAHHGRAQNSLKLQRLTRREKEIMNLLVEGKQNKQIASLLGISCRTVEAHRSKLMKKLGAKSVSEVVRIALFK
jgi:FixJ family two-component response regulator